MQPISSNDINTSLNLLAEAAENHQHDIEQHNPDKIIDSDEENDSPAPLFDRFYIDGGSAAIKNMTNFSPDRIEFIWNSIEDEIDEKFNIGRGKKSSVSPKDCFFMTLTVLNHGGTWDFLARIFNCKGANFERLIVRFIKNAAPLFYEKFVIHNEKAYTMSRLSKNKNLFNNHPYARYATDVCFQQSYRPSGSMMEAHPWYSGKHKLHGYKFEASVLPIGLCISCSPHFRGRRSDLEIMQGRKKYHDYASKKKDGEAQYTDEGEGVELFGNHSGILVDKGYQGIKEFLRGIHPIRKPIGRILTPNELHYNKNVSSDRIIVENYFGRLLTLWSVLSHKWKWSEDLYDSVLNICVGLTNVHIKMNPLRHSDCEFFQKYRNGLHEIGQSNVEKRRLAQRRYRQKRARQMNIQFRAMSGGDSTETESPSHQL